MASKKFFVDVDMLRNKLQNAVFESLNTAPASPVNGQIYFDTSSSQLKYYNGTEWVPITEGDLYSVISLGEDNASEHLFAIYDSTEGTVFKFRAVKALSNKIQLALSNGIISIDADISKSDVGLGNVDNTSDVNKPVSTAQQDALQAAITALNLGTASTKDVGVSAGQVPILDDNGLLNENILPALAISDTYPIQTHAEMLALTDVQRGDVCVVADESKSYILKKLPADVDANWIPLKSPTADVNKAYVDTQDAVTLSTVRGSATDSYNTLGKVETIIKDNKQSADDLFLTKPNIYVASATEGNNLVIASTIHKCGSNPVCTAYCDNHQVVVDVQLDVNGNITVNWNLGVSASTPLKIVIIGI